ncbi:hypothetical protein PESP_a0492 [Pseudoalteromonas espejiana DSM 9414]|nr:hypothetical protein PESP_a0492 [Pseudoalteromonas espejiana DSM 9414]
MPREAVETITYKYFLSESFQDYNFDALIHLAGAAHEAYSDKEAYSLNVDLSKKVLTKASWLGIPKVIYLSTANVYLNNKGKANVFSTLHNVSRLNNTTKTKLEAEQYVKESSLTYTIIRSPLVYGEGVKANFSSLMRLINKGLPLPFRAIKNNKRSLVSVYNLVDLIKVCIEHPKAANQEFLVSDDNDMSTAEMVALMAKVQNKKNIALPVPIWCFKLAGKLLNKADVINRLTGSLQLDITHTKNTLNWTPPYSVEHGFELAAKKSTRDN